MSLYKMTLALRLLCNWNRWKLISRGLLVEAIKIQPQTDQPIIVFIITRSILNLCLIRISDCRVQQIQRDSFCWNYSCTCAQKAILKCKILQHYNAKWLFNWLYIYDLVDVLKYPKYPKYNFLLWNPLLIQQETQGSQITALKEW